MKIKQVSINGLFGIFNHTIPLNIIEHITIIHGPNGFGKTVLLSMVDGMFKGNFSIFYRIPFDTFKIDFDNGSFAQLQKIKTEDSKKFKLLFLSPETGKDPIDLSPKNIKEEEVGIPLAAIDDIIPELSRIGPREWRNIRTGQMMNFEDVIQRYGEILDIEGRFSNSAVKKISNLVQTHFIKTDRLRTRTPVEIERPYSIRRHSVDESTPAIIDYSQDLAGRIKQTLGRYAELSSSLDRSFPMRLIQLISKERKPKLFDEKIRSELASLEDKRSRLMNAGLMDKDQGNVQLPEQVVNDPIGLVLNIYIEDVQSKLEVFDDDLRKIELLRNIATRRFNYKQLSIEKEKGFVFTSTDGTELPLNALSSGEQHEIVLLYDLLFKVKPNSLILIDEPEISLHIGWQQEFLNDLIAITRLSEFDVLIATHSPDIINDRWDLTIGLEGPEGTNGTKGE
jgi:ABC-type transport system involved in cytochrome c biogenesis ATPase subunit